MKEEIRKSHGHRKTKEVFSFDDGLAEQQGSFLTVARPIMAALMNLDSPPNDEGEGGPDPEVVPEMLEDALVLLGNANTRLNVCRQRRFSDYLTDLGRRTLREGIPADRHLFPHHFYEKFKSEHDHKASTSELICKPKTGPKPWSGSQSFRDFTSFKRGQQTGRGNGATSLEGPVLHLSTTKTAEGPDEHQILTSQLTTPTATDYLSSAPPLSLSVNQTANRLGTSLTNWNLLTTDKWILQAVSGYKIPLLRPPHQ